MKVAVNVHLKKGVLDPQGKAVLHALETLGFKNVEDVRVGKQIIIEINTNNKEEAIKEAKEMADKLLANPVIENYKIEVKE
ncbi:phosphoribosylformylglycinamidine synthase subunit PurS [Caminibacter mediatlanticus TB-2]|uniref:Phosphoribosylformylglycinamidine synthase subunit PurS n=1 Tax=Caminibacter mediatlanticus TB-2 TaxID=391592 RepID=A0AAI9AFT5_9BACT|nr:phosphoribosylformylglycinamidine synthase subunit PurS [Caminibacter mediatlanticus]EDM22842.1 Phosphoribosylformylglycinamidine synthetase PurS [Caminibacter mediatlanticus TB-2]QCT94509.1 phosphoribosylformylglycinamidine synthase subunit PurS [Caminibacter mediatlanticus TB-2]